MSRNNEVLRFLFFCLFLSFWCNAYAQRDTLELFTKIGCSNCQAAKQQLHQSGISFVEHGLADNENGRLMLQRLASAGYKDKIYLPVVFLNKRLMHPAFQSDTGLVSLPLPTVIDSVVLNFLRGKLHFPVVNNVNQSQEDLPLVKESDCEVKTTPIYLICANHSTEKEAKLAMNQLINEGYAFAGIVYHQKLYRVYSKFFFDKEIANSELLAARKSSKIAYLLEVK